MKSTQTHWRWFFLLAALEAGAAFIALMLVPREGSGFSISRLTLLAVLCAFCVLWIYFALRPPDGLDRLARPSTALAASLLSLTFAVSLFLLRYLNLKHVDPALLLTYYQRLSPLLFYLLVLSLQSSFFFLFIHFGFHRENLLQRKPILQSAFVAFCLLLSAFIFISLTRLGLTPDTAYWGEPGVPIMGWQLILALLGGLCVLCFALFFSPPIFGENGGSRRRAKGSYLNYIIPVALWLLAVVTWLAVPISVMQNSFYAPMDPPTFQPFPNSDAGYYDSMAHSLLIGYPYQGDIPTRPLYIVLLAVLHLIVGERYDLIIAGQTLLLALIPVILYYLGKKLHSRAAGVIVALIAIFREWTTLLISSNTRVSDTKTLLVDLPTLFLILLACLFALRWLERRDWKSALAAGGTFGLLLLLRTQSLLILPFIFLAAFLAFGRKNRKPFFLLSLFFIAGLVAAVFPWLLHNYLVSGHITFDAPFQYQVIASQYQYTGNLDLGGVDLQGKNLFGILLTFALRDPRFVFGFIATHFFATQIDGLLALPLIEKYNGIAAPINLYWITWDGYLQWYNLLLVIFYLAIIALGLGAAWKRLRWIGLVPLAFSLGYSLANGIGRFSGWRYDLPADWIAYFYFSIGAAEIFASLALFFGAKPEKLNGTLAGSPAPDPPPVASGGILRKGGRGMGRLMQGLLLAGAFALIGALPWFAEGIASPRYADQTSQKMIAELADSSAIQQISVDRTQIESFTLQPQAVLRVGRVLYPRFFTRNIGISSAHPWPAYAPRDFPRMGFLLLSQRSANVLFPSKQIPDPFPQAADAIILGCQRDGYIEVRLILFHDSDIAYLSAPLTEPCP